MSLEARALAFGFPDRTIGEGIELAIADGTIACLLGPNGSGKTTLLRTLLGVLEPRAGDIMVDGRSIRAMGERERARSIAYVPQASEGYLDFSVREMVAMARTAHRGMFSPPSARDHAVAESALARLGLAAIAERAIERVSGGERQLAFIARALATEARVLLMDEPTASLDFANQARVLDEIARLREQGCAVLFTTHHPDHALRIADQALLLRGGRLIAHGPPASSMNPANLSALYGRPVDVVEIPSGTGRPRRVCVASGAARFD